MYTHTHTFSLRYTLSYMFFPRLNQGAYILGFWSKNSNALSVRFLFLFLHAFAIQRCLAWIRIGINVSSFLFSTSYLGHRVCSILVIVVVLRSRMRTLANYLLSFNHLLFFGLSFFIYKTGMIPSCCDRWIEVYKSKG